MNLLGVPDAPEDLELGLVQRDVMRFLRDHGTVSKDEAGAIAHNHRGKHHLDARCAFCSTDGDDILAALVRRHLVERSADGMVQLPRPVRAVGPSDDLPDGF